MDRRVSRGVKPGLERISGVLDLMADPHRAAPAIHVAGTNGKTSVARFAAAIIDAHGLTSGSFTSPHLQRPEQMFAVGGEVMTADQLAEVIGSVAPFVELFEERTGDHLTWFEVMTAAAFDWFADRAVAAMVVEVGLGGSRDATAVLEAPVVVLATAALDHADWFGHTVAETVAEELTIVRRGATLVTGRLPPEAEAAAESAAADRGASWLRWGSDFRAEETRQAVGGWSFDLAGVHEAYDDLFLPVHGRHQVHNFAVATAAVEALFGRPLDPEAVREAAGSATAPGRMEMLHSEPPLMLDGAHNPAGAVALAAALNEEFPTTRWVLVIGAMVDKDLPGLLAPLRGLVAEVHACAAVTSRARPPEEVAAAAEDVLGPDLRVSAHRTVSEAVTAAQEAGGPVLVTGSLHVAGEARTALGFG